LHQTIAGNGEPAEPCIDFARRHSLELVQRRKLDPIHVEIELAFELPHKRQGQFVEATTDKPDPQAVRLAESSFSAIIQRGAKHQGRGFHTEAQLRAEVCYLNSPAGPDEQPAAYLTLQGANRFGHRGLREVKSLSRFAEM
jgi:hypothetical protein